MNKAILILTLTLCSLHCFCQSFEDKSAKKMLQTMWLIDNMYVDTADFNKLTDKAIVAMLKELDPHSVYIPQKDVQKANEPLQGNIEGIGVSFQLNSDTIHIVDVVADGPSEKVGIIPGDKIIKVNDSLAVGDSIDNEWVMNHLRGKKGTKVKVDILRANRGIITFDITRDKIPLNSIDTWFMIDDKIGYISLRRFAMSSCDEFISAVKDLKKQGMKKLIFDLRGNGGGYLNIAQDICAQLLEGKKLIVYTKGSKAPNQELYSNKKGVWEKGDLIVLTDEYTASASEITSGNVQDWDRGLVVGRRTFGKGLVQNPIPMVDGSQIRLTISRYYIPSGRCIQKPYDKGTDEYYKDYQERYSHKEMFYADSNHFADSIKYHTNNGRVVYGGGGIMPDVFVPMDTNKASDYFINLRSKNLFTDFALLWAEDNREAFLKKYPTYEDFDKVWDSLHLMNDFESFAKQKGVNPSCVKKEQATKIINDLIFSCLKDSAIADNFDSYENYVNYLINDKSLMDSLYTRIKAEDNKQRQYMQSSIPYIESNLKGIVARNLYGIKYYYKAIAYQDETLQRAIALLKNEKLYKSLLKSNTATK